MSFKHDTQAFPAVLSDTGKLHSGKKSQLAKILESTTSCPDEQTECDGIALDGSSFVQLLSPKTSKILEEYVIHEAVPNSQTYSSK